MTQPPRPPASGDTTAPASASASASKLPLLPRAPATMSPDEVLARQQAREQKDAEVRGVTSIDAMRAAIRDAARSLPHIATIARVPALDGAAFRRRAAEGLPFLINGVVNRWPLSAHAPGGQ
ncbi:MAG: hypothetical protein H7270_08315 [Dermatophilaceae bacterium]|nr:hypothetical protein [Dermatophilaceae bacterium]